MLSDLGVITHHPKSLSHGRDGLPYCEADYHTKFGIRCDGCEKYITGRVLEVSSPPEGRLGLSGLGPPHAGSSHY
jgi:hypothetical protein